MLQVTCAQDDCGRTLDRGDMLHVHVEFRGREFAEDDWRAAGYPVDSEPFFTEFLTKKTMTFCSTLHAARTLLGVSLP